MDMLRFLTQKLRSQSLNEVQPFQINDVDDSEDSGTESDIENEAENDEPTRTLPDILSPAHPHTPTHSDNIPSFTRSLLVERHMASSPRSLLVERHMASSLGGSSDFDTHTPSSNGSSDFDLLSSEDDELNSIMIKQEKVFKIPNIHKSGKRKCSGRYTDNSGSSDDEVKDLFTQPPVCFSSSPPRGIQSSPPRGIQKLSCSPMPKLFLANTSSWVKVTEKASRRKRHRPAGGAANHSTDGHVIYRRPYLDFDKMQQKAIGKKHLNHSRGLGRLVKIRSTRSDRGLYPDPEMFAFRSISTSYMTPVEAPPMAY